MGEGGLIVGDKCSFVFFVVGGREVLVDEWRGVILVLGGLGVKLGLAEVLVVVEVLRASVGGLGVLGCLQLVVQHRLVFAVLHGQFV